MEPSLAVPDQLRPVLDELRKLEPLFHLANDGMAAHELASLMEPHFWEVGASGRRYSREFVLGVLAQRQQHPDDEAWETRDFHCAEIAPHNYLLTYTLVQPGRITRRATLWRRHPGGWKAVYHQGTVAEGPPDPTASRSDPPAAERLRKPLPAGYRQGIVSAITIFIGFSLAFLRFWAFEAPGAWNLLAILETLVLAIPIGLEIYALFRSLRVSDDDEHEYMITVRWFVASVITMLVSIVFAAVVLSGAK